jgi:hypothetical protein
MNGLIKFSLLLAFNESDEPDQQPTRGCDSCADADVADRQPERRNQRHSRIRGGSATQNGEKHA